MCAHWPDFWSSGCLAHFEKNAHKTQHTMVGFLAPSMISQNAQGIYNVRAQWRSEGPAGPATAGARGAEGVRQGPAREKKSP